jgi:hypothetical protein
MIHWCIKPLLSKSYERMLTLGHGGHGDSTMKRELWNSRRMVIQLPEGCDHPPLCVKRVQVKIKPKPPLKSKRHVKYKNREHELDQQP